MFQYAGQETPEVWGICKNAFVTGKEVLYQVLLGTWEVRASLTCEESFREGDRIPLRIRKDGIYFFDAENGRRIRQES